MARDPPINRLIDEFGAYSLSAVCRECGHTRNVDQGQLARIFGWLATQASTAARMRCSRCQKKACDLRVSHARKSSRYPDPRN